MELDSLKYMDLQRLAKNVGLKANMKADKLLKSLKQHFQQLDSNAINGNEIDVPSSQRDDADLIKGTDATSADFVTKRRGKGPKTKRKRSDQGGAEGAPKLQTQINDQCASPDKGSERAKRRRVSLVEASPIAAVPPESKENPAEHKEAMSTERVKGKAIVQPAGKIPRHEGLMKLAKPLLKPTTPNFKKLHEAHFNKMESIDSYVHRKTRQIESYRNEVKELKLLSEKTILKPMEGKVQSKSTRGHAALFSPAPLNERPAPNTRRHTQLPASKPAPTNQVPFRPSVLTTRRINVRFSQAAQDNGNKQSMVKTPRVSTPANRTPKNRMNPEVNKMALFSNNKTPGATAFVFTGNTSSSNTPGTNKKAFDLKASLSRPLAYKPHKGKLKPFGETQENTALNRSQNVSSLRKNYKQHQVQTREDRRTKHTKERKQKKEGILGARRGLTMS